MISIDGSTATLIAAFLSAFAGSVLGPIILRRQRKGDTALEERRRWAKEKLRFVFGEGEEQMSTDDVNYNYQGMIPPGPFVPWWPDSHSLNFRLTESVDLRLVQPRRSSLAQRWLEAWTWILFTENELLRSAITKDNSADLSRFPDLAPTKDNSNELFEDEDFQQLMRRYSRLVRSVENKLTLWSLGLRPSLFLWVSLRRAPGVGRARAQQMEEQLKKVRQRFEESPGDTTY